MADNNYIKFKSGTLSQVTSNLGKPDTQISVSTDITSIFKGDLNLTNRVIDASLFNNTLGLRKIDASGNYDSEFINMDFARPYNSGNGILVDNSTGTISLDPSYEMFEIVSTLPTANIDKNKIYLVPKQDDSSVANNIYTEYHYLGSGTWEILGDRQADIASSLKIADVSLYEYPVDDISVGDPYDTAFNKLQSQILHKQIYIPVTHAELTDLRDNGQLVPGNLYRITDYQCTTTQENTQSAGHQFDVIVTATDVDTLNENAKVVKHEGDTYFANSNLDAWKIKYSLDNDKNSFAWADETNGKGVIYRLIDEFNNDCPYDFKNIQFKRKLTNGVYDSTNGTDTWVYTFNYWDGDNGVCLDAGIVGNTNQVPLDNAIYGVHDNEIGPYIDKNYDMEHAPIRILNNNVFLDSFSVDDYFGTYNNVLGQDCVNNNFGHNCKNNTLGNECVNNNFGHYCQKNNFENNCYGNTFGSNCSSNTFGAGCYGNTFGNACDLNTFGISCYSNTFRNDCNYNTFGNNCYNITLGEVCDHNIFGNYCRFIKFTNNISGTPNSCYRYITIEDNVEFVLLRYTGTLNTSNRLQNIKICTGVKGTSSSYKQITHPTVNDTFQTIYRNDESGTTEGGIVALKSDLSSYVTSGYYDSSTHKIYLRHDTDVLSEIDANDFIKDGMVDTAYVQGSNLVISFNTDAGKQPIQIPIADIFNPTNYYTKSDIDNAGYLTSFTETDPTVPSYVKNITESDIVYWNTKVNPEDLNVYLTKSEAATATTYGVVKLNPDGSVVLNENGQLVVNGILGQYPNGGLYYPVSSEPTNVGNYTLLISEAKNLSTVHRDFIIAGGTNITLKTAAAAGATQYRVANSQDNRFFCSAMIGGRLATNEAGAKTKTVAIKTIQFASGDVVVPYHGATTETNNDIIITVEETLNPDTTLTAIRGYGKWTSADVISVGQGNRASIGKLMQIGQAQVAENSGTQNLMVGIRNYSTASSSIMIGSTNINKQQYSCTIGQGHDNSNGRTGIVLFGSWSAPSTKTVLAIGDGAGPSNRKNIFEITSGNNNETGIVLRAPNGNRYKLSVDNSGSLVTTSV